MRKSTPRHAGSTGKDRAPADILHPASLPVAHLLDGMGAISCEAVRTILILATSATFEG